MARLPYRDAADLDEADRDLLKRPININRVLVNSPKCRRAGLAFARYIRHESAVDPRLRELAILQVGYSARSRYEWSHHIKVGEEFGVSEADVHGLIALNQGRPADFDEVARAAIAAAREMTEAGAASDETFATLRRHLGPAEIVDLVVAIAHYNGTVRVLATLEVDVEPEYLPYLEKFPLPQ